MKNSKWQKVKNILTIFFFIILVFLITVLFFVRTEYSNIIYEELIFHLNVPLEGSQTPFVGNFFKEEAFALVIGMLFIIAVGFFMSKMFWHSFTLKIKMKKGKKTKTKRIKIKNNLRFFVIIPLVIILFVIYLMAKQIKFDEYIYNVKHPTKIYEKYYVDAKETQLTFPEAKRNLIYIYLESMESSYGDLSSDISEINNLIPHLEELAEENINFSDTNSLGGAYQTFGVGWTMSGMVAQSAGIPLTIPVSPNSMEFYKKFLPNVITLGDVLEQEGYNQELIMGSYKEFGGREKYFSQHGHYELYDINTAKEKKKIPENYSVWWGFEDSKLFQYAKEELLNLADEERPFNFQMLTVNTHFDQGYVEDSCQYDLSNQYATSVVCSDEQVYDFIRWIQEQDFYENTTVVITGDHLMMGEYFYQGKKSLDNRRVYNAFINSYVVGGYSNDNTRNRTFTTLDMYPTTLASMGVKIRGDRLGLGTNLFSGKKTLAEELGKTKLDSELKKTSEFYKNKLLYVK